MKVETAEDADEVWKVVGRTTYYPRSFFDSVVKNGGKYFRFLLYRTNAINSIYFVEEYSDDRAMIIELYSDCFRRDEIVQGIFESLPQKSIEFNTFYDGVPLYKYNAPYTHNQEILVCEISNTWHNERRMLPDYDVRKHGNGLVSLLTKGDACWFGKRQLGEFMRIVSRIENGIGVVKLEKKGVIGYGGSVYDAKGKAYVHTVYVHEDYREEYIGGEIATNLLSRLHKKGAKMAFLSTEGNNETAMALYKDAGFRSSGRYFHVFEIREKR